MSEDAIRYNKYEQICSLIVHWHPASVANYELLTNITQLTLYLQTKTLKLGWWDILKQLEQGQI